MESKCENIERLGIVPGTVRGTPPLPSLSPLIFFIFPCLYLDYWLSLTQIRSWTLYLLLDRFPTLLTYMQCHILGGILSYLFKDLPQGMLALAHLLIY